MLADKTKETANDYTKKEEWKMSLKIWNIKPTKGKIRDDKVEVRHSRH